MDFLISNAGAALYQRAIRVPNLFLHFMQHGSWLTQMVASNMFAVIHEKDVGGIAAPRARDSCCVQSTSGNIGTW